MVDYDMISYQKWDIGGTMWYLIAEISGDTSYGILAQMATTYFKTVMARDGFLNSQKRLYMIRSYLHINVYVDMHLGK